MRRFLRSEEGQIEIILPFLILLLVTAMVWSVKGVQLVTLADVNLKQSVALSVKAAASQGLEREDAYIDPETARETFEEMLVRNLGLDLTTLEALESSPWQGGLEYKLWVYNGTGGVEYVFQDGRLEEREIPGKGFPQVFTVNDAIEVALPAAGVIGVVSLEARSIVGAPVKCERWAAARLENEGSYKCVVLQKSGA
ncbi:hypothetical protein V3F56_02880 [Moorellaceae bacterium AZ2]